MILSTFQMILENLFFLWEMFGNPKNGEAEYEGDGYIKIIFLGVVQIFFYNFGGKNSEGKSISEI